MTVPKAGPLSPAELLDVWKGALDRSYRDPLLEAGDGEGLEAHTQAIETFARASRAIDVTTQAMFICPWSGQTNEPAAGARKATVVLTFRRTKLLDRPLVLGKGLIFVEEQTTDWGDPGGVTVTTGRRYVLAEDLVFHPGETGPFDVVAEAEGVGYGYNNPRAGTLRLIAQPGFNFENNLATVLVQIGTILGNALASSNTAIVTTPNEPDTFVPDHVGQYFQFSAGNNATKIARVVQFEGPDLAAIPPIGSAIVASWDQSVQGTTTGTFQPGERIVRNPGPTPDLFATLLGVRETATGSGEWRATFTLLAATSPLVAGDVLVGATSGATLTVGTVLSGQDFVAEAPIGITGGATWRILDWAVSWGLTVTNVFAPEGGRLGWLDELGFERSLQRSPGEDDETYRQRIKSIADVVTPNAIRRTLSRTLGAIPWCFREVGTEYLPGFFYDGDLSAPNPTPHGPLNDAYDYDSILADGRHLFPGRQIVDVIEGAGYIWALEADSPNGFLHRIDKTNGSKTTFTVPSAVQLLPSGASPRMDFQDSSRLFFSTGTRYIFVFDSNTSTFVGIGDVGSTRFSSGLGCSTIGSGYVGVATEGPLASDYALRRFDKIGMYSSYPTPATPTATILATSFPLTPDQLFDVRPYPPGGGHMVLVTGYDFSSTTASGFLVDLLTPFVFASVGQVTPGLPLSIHWTASNAICVTFGAADPVVRIYTSGFLLAATIPTTIANPYRMTSDPVANVLWIEDASANPGQFARVNLNTLTLIAATTTPFPVVFSGGLVFDSSGNAWFGSTSGLFLANGTTLAFVLSFFRFQEFVEIEDATTGDNYATGWFGRIDLPDGSRLVFIRKDGAIPNPVPANMRARGTESGAVFDILAESPNPARSSRRFHMYMDYSQFRGFFLVCLPPLGLGEFGFAYGDHPVNAFDAPAPYENFYDGYPYLNSIVYGRVYQAIDQVRAGGVLFDLCLDDGSCP